MQKYSRKYIQDKIKRSGYQSIIWLCIIPGILLIASILGKRNDLVIFSLVLITSLVIFELLYILEYHGCKIRTFIGIIKRRKNIDKNRYTLYRKLTTFLIVDENRKRKRFSIDKGAYSIQEGNKVIVYYTRFLKIVISINNIQDQP